MKADVPRRQAVHNRYTFGPFFLDEHTLILSRDGEMLRLPPKAVETLLVLVQRAGQVVTRDELLERVWPGSFVEPNNLAQQVSMVRNALEDRGARPRYVETVSRRGYRFVAPVTRQEEAEAPRPAPPSTRPSAPQVRYARSGHVNIAYQVIGSGPIDVVFVMGWVSHLEEFWTEPSFARFLTRLASFSRLIIFDKRGTGLSDRVVELPTLEERMDDVRAVMDAVGSTRAALFGVSEGGPMCSLFAATYPERTVALVMFGSYARRLWAPDYPWGPTELQREAFHREIEQQWGGPVGIDVRAPSRADDPAFREWWAHYLRQGASPGAALALTRMNAEVDVRDILPLVRVPSLVIHRSGDHCLRVEEGRYVASRIPGSHFVELPGSDHLPFVGDQDAVTSEIEHFLGTFAHVTGEERALATVLCVNERTRAAEHGPRADALIAAIAMQTRGQWFGSRESPWLMTFDGPARAIRAAAAMMASLGDAGIEASAGLHTGECTQRDGRISGMAVDLARAIAEHAAPSELLISRTVKDLVAGAGFRFVDRGRHTMPLDAGEWRLYGKEEG
jgi:DNA-binding winged helix-turn-helix (wHTH) protein/pimeloyl-ACP methyl ester carboxylesterase